MKLLWLGLGAAAAYVLLKKEGSPAATVLTSTPVPGLAPTRCAEWEAYSKSCADLAAMGASCEAWVGAVPQGCPPPPATPMKQRIAEAELRAKAVLATATGACCPQGRICIATMPLCKSGPSTEDYLLSAW